MSVGSASNERRVTNVAAGASATDAVNVSQLDSEAAKSNSIGVATAAALGGGATYDAKTGSIVAPRFQVGGETVDNLSDAIANLDDHATRNATAIANVEGSVTDLAQQLDAKVGLVKQDADTQAITVASATGGASIDFTGTDGARTLSGVADGQLNSDSKEAVNGSQLAATNDRVSSAESNIAQNAADIAGNTSAIGGLDTRVGTAESNIAQNTTDIAGNTSAIGSLDTRIGNAESNIETNASAIGSVKDSVTNLTQQLGSGSLGLMQQDADTKAITVASAAGGALVDFTGADGARVLSGVKDGRLEAGSSEAVNGSQLAATNTRMLSAEDSIAKNTSDIAANTSTISNIDGRVSNVEGSVTNLANQLTTGEVGLVKQDADTRALAVASVTGGTLMDITGTDGARRLTGVADGNVAANSSDAVNGSQLAETNTNVAQNKSDIANNTSKIADIDGRVTDTEGSIAKNTADIAENTANLSGLMNGSVGLVRQNTANGDIAIGSEVGGSAINVAGTDGVRVVRGVANGTDNTDAVTIAQLKAVGLVDPTGQTLGALVYDDLSFGRATLGGTNGTVIGNLANGLVAANSMEAVNGGQLYALQDQFETQYKQLFTQYDQLNVQVNYLGEQIVNNAEGPVNPALPGTGSGSTAVGSGAIASGDNSTVLGSGAAATGNGSTATGNDASASGENSTALGSNSSATGNNAVALGQGSVADRDNSVSVGSAGNERQITNVAAGTAPTDAVNLGQVNGLLSQGVQQANNYTDQRFDQANHAINQVARNAYAGVAAAMAMPNMTPSGPGRTIVAAGVGNYKNGSALAAGATYRSQNGKWLMNGAVSVTSTGDAGVRAQVGYEF
ncbi:YadA family autotransporter adhesin [Paraburkholderia sp. ZP32-5]|uniref:YadA family autotransporter adhesin n=1 Tax=Paraburkholderia sp. ZP32-5 TaxID=2883245 RepID=UPI001F198794|nr:YadA-like family protein [Paraburkholderia sp. ZP32-5]